MKHIFPILCMAACLLSSCGQQAGKKPEETLTDSMSLVMKVSQQSKLYTAEYQIHKIVTHEDLLQVKGSILGYRYDKKLELGEKKIAIPINVTMKAYVDFSAFSSRNVKHMGDFIHIILPDPRVVVTSSQVEYDQIREFTSMIRNEYTDKEKSQIIRMGVESIVRQAPELGIVETARTHAAQMLIPTLTQMGYKEDHIIITFRDNLNTENIRELYDNEGSTIKLN